MPFKFDTKKALSYQFDQPKRQLIAKNQAVPLGNPLSKNINNSPQHYYSANGHICRNLSAQRTACYINNNWYKSTRIMTLTP